jgi:hypothetical protein
MAYGLVSYVRLDGHRSICGMGGCMLIELKEGLRAFIRYTAQN